MFSMLGGKKVGLFTCFYKYKAIFSYFIKALPIMCLTTKWQNHFTAMTVSRICGLNRAVMVCSSAHNSPLLKRERGFLPTMHPQTNRGSEPQKGTFSKASR